MKRYIILLLISLLFTGYLPAQNRYNDSLALVALYNSTNGNNWVNKTNWLSNQPIDNWFGITVFSNRVIKITLPSNKLDGTIPIQIADLSALESIDFQWNQLTGNIPLVIGNLINLKGLALSANNSLGGTIPPSLGNLKNLELLSLSVCGLSGAIPVEIFNLRKLKFLDLSFNDFTGGIPFEIGNLDSLVSLSFNICPKLGGTIPQSIGNLKELNGLNLRRCNLSGTIPKEIGKLVNLASLNLGDNGLTGSIPEEFGNLVNLEVLHMYWCTEITGKLPDTLGNLKKLRELWISATQVSGEIPTSFGNLSSLTRLWMNGNMLEGSVPVEINKLSNLQSMDLSGNRLLNFPEITSMAALKELSIISNRLEFDDIEPNINISYDVFTYFPQDSIGQLINDTACLGYPYRFSIYCGGKNNRYQWFKGDVPVSSVSTDPSFTIPSIDMAHEGVYYCHVTNTIVDSLTLYSRAANVKVVNMLEPPIISENNGTLSSNKYENIQWFHNKTLIPGATGVNYKPLFSGKFSAKIKRDGGCESGFSNEIYIVFNKPYETVKREWGTYYGGNGIDFLSDVVVDSAGNVYVVGTTFSNEGISSPGAFQTNKGSVDSCDAFVAKFNPKGERIWSTYFGGTGNDLGYSIVIDPLNNVLISGETYSDNNIASPGAHQTKFNGSQPPWPNSTMPDAFIAKFDSSGKRLWSTYYGGVYSEEVFNKVQTDIYGNIYLGGKTSSINGPEEIATKNAFKTDISGVREGFLVKFNPQGKRLWGTYYGGEGNWDSMMGITVDKDFNIYFSGRTDSENTDSCIATYDAYKTSLPTDKYNTSYIAVFDSSGNRLYGSYYIGGYNICDIALDDNKNLYLTGYRQDSSGNQDAFVDKFNIQKGRIWGTLYGGTREETGYSIVTNELGNIFFSGLASSSEPGSISTCNAHQEKKGGDYYNYDNYLAKFDSSANRVWGTYYGGAFGETSDWNANGIIADISGSIYLCGNTNSMDGISTLGSHQVLKNDTTDGFLVKFYTDTIYPPVVSITGNTEICKGDSIYLIVKNNSDSLQWYQNDKKMIGENNDSLEIKPTKPDGIYKYYVVLGTDPCAIISDTITITILPKPVVDAGTDKYIAVGETLQIGGNPSATGGNQPYSYEWYPPTRLSATIESYGKLW